MLFLSRFLQRFHKSEKHKQDTVDGVPCIGDKGKPYRCKLILLDDTELVIDIRVSFETKFCFLNNGFKVQ